MFAAASSKVPYYVAGGLLAAWAVLLAFWGITHHQFPRSPGRARGVMLTSLLLVVATMTTAVVTGGEAAGHARAVAGRLTGLPGRRGHPEVRRHLSDAWRVLRSATGRPSSRVILLARRSCRC